MYTLTFSFGVGRRVYSRAMISRIVCESATNLYEEFYLAIFLRIISLLFLYTVVLDVRACDARRFANIGLVFPSEVTCTCVKF